MKGFGGGPIRSEGLLILRGLSRKEWMAVLLMKFMRRTLKGQEAAMVDNLEKVMSNLICHHPLPHGVTEENVNEIIALKALSITTPVKERRLKSVEDEEDRAELGGMDGCDGLSGCDQGRGVRWL